MFKGSMSGDAQWKQFQFQFKLQLLQQQFVGTATSTGKLIQQ